MFWAGAVAWGLSSFSLIPHPPCGPHMAQAVWSGGAQGLPVHLADPREARCKRKMDGRGVSYRGDGERERTEARSAVAPQGGRGAEWEGAGTRHGDVPRPQVLPGLCSGAGSDRAS